mmetsp:Transcript_44103/g.73420  ORF Transcript_44103/g.73420 Transcript_44103/m.73420 type:complete len:573 (-) Transcript_44103:751-2469(-)
MTHGRSALVDDMDYDAQPGSSHLPPKHGSGLNSHAMNILGRGGNFPSMSTGEMHSQPVIRREGLRSSTLASLKVDTLSGGPSRTKPSSNLHSTMRRGQSNAPSTSDRCQQEMEMKAERRGRTPGVYNHVERTRDALRSRGGHDLPKVRGNLQSRATRNNNNRGDAQWPPATPGVLPLQTANTSISRMGTMFAHELRPRTKATAANACRGDYCNTLNFPDGLHAFEEEAMKCDLRHFGCTTTGPPHPFNNNQEILVHWRKGVLDSRHGPSNNDCLKVPAKSIHVEREERTSSQTSAHSAPATWSFKVSSSEEEWQSYPLEESAKIEAAYEQGLDAVQLDSKHMISLKKMCQYKVTNPHRGKLIRREPPTDELMPSMPRMGAKTPLPSLGSLSHGTTGAFLQGDLLPVCRDCFRIYMFREAQRSQREAAPEDMPGAATSGSVGIRPSPSPPRMRGTGTDARMSDASPGGLPPMHPQTINQAMAPPHDDNIWWDNRPETRAGIPVDTKAGGGKAAGDNWWESRPETRGCERGVMGGGGFTGFQPAADPDPKSKKNVAGHSLEEYMHEQPTTLAIY